MNAQQQRMMEGARNYAAADRSDPFAFQRAMTHMRNGIASPGQDGNDAFYKADPAQEARMLPEDGRSEEERTYHVTVYRNVQRP